MSSRPATRYETLDLVRGVCAIFVMVLHGRFMTGIELAPSAYLPVDLFFMMSGFVVGHAYDRKLMQGGYFRMFMLRRYARLLPMWVIGLTISFAFSLAFFVRRGAPLSVPINYALELLLLPAAIGDDFFTGNQPGWSLFFELCANLAYGLLARRLNVRALVVITMLGAIALSLLGWSNGSLNGGSKWATVPLGFARVTFGFSLGLLFFKLPRRPAAPRFYGIFLALLVAFCVAMMVEPPAHLRALFDLGITLLLMPALLQVALLAEERMPMVAEVLGIISYPLYAVHFGVMMAWMSFRGVAFGWWSKDVSWPAAVLVETALLLFAFLLGRFVDPAVQSWLGRHILRRPVSLPSIEEARHAR